MSLTQLRDLWCKFWFEPRSPVPLALFRIMFSLLVLESLYHFASDFSMYYGVNCVFPLDAVANLRWNLDPHFDLFLLLPNADAWRWAVFSSFVLAALSLAFGCLTRWSALWLYFGLVTLQTHCQFNLNAGDRYETLVALLLALSNAGDALSIDNLIAKRNQDWRTTGFETDFKTGWVVRLLQLQVALAYCHTFFSKLAGEQWVNGSVIYTVTRYRDFHRFSLPFLYDTALGCKLATWATLLMELSLWTLIWIKEFRYWVLAAGVFMHLTIDLTMNIPVFEGLFISSYILFVDAADLRRVMQWLNNQIAQQFGKPAVLAFDGQCIFCVRTAGIVHRLDIFNRLVAVDFRDRSNDQALDGIDYNRAEKEMLVNTGDAWLGGYRAFRWIAVRLPLLWALVPILYLPGITAAGDRVYAWVAAHRYTFLGRTCEEGACYAHKP